MLAYLCVINNRADELRLQRIINNPVSYTHLDVYKRQIPCS